MSGDPDEDAMEDAIERNNPLRVPDTLDRIEWRLQYGEYGGLTGIKITLWIIAILLALILWRIW